MFLSTSGAIYQRKDAKGRGARRETAWWLGQINRYRIRIMCRA